MISLGHGAAIGLMVYAFGGGAVSAGFGGGGGGGAVTSAGFGGSLERLFNFFSKS